MFVYDYVIYNGEPIMEFRLKYLNNYVDQGRTSRDSGETDMEII